MVNNGKPKNQAIRDEIANSESMTIVLNGDGSISSVAGGGHPPMPKAEFDFEHFYLACTDNGDETIHEILDIKSMTILITRVREKNPVDPKKAKTAIEKYIWESSRHWW